MDKQGWVSRRGPNAGECRIDLTVLDADAMDVALSLMPDLQLAAVAVARANRAKNSYPISTSSQLAGLLRIAQPVWVGDLLVDFETLRSELAAGDLPVNNALDLAQLITSLLERCRQHQQGGQG